uniref:Uncharacterized protein n=1 Tax=Rhizophora mucronata TaxID=61149 RepID=A0A2P2P7Y3_RHIMU
MRGKKGKHQKQNSTPFLV